MIPAFTADVWTVGIDLSLTGLGLCAIPGEWNPAHPSEWARIRRVTLTTKAGGPLVARADALAENVVEWLLWCGKGSGKNLRVCHEGYPVGGRVYNLDKLCELGGIVKRAIWDHPDLDIEVTAVPQSTARKLICGKLPQRDRKAVTIKTLRAMAGGALDGATDDECDAIVAANCHRKTLGLSFFAMPEPAKEPRARKGRKAA
jgi:hypothetical protein